MLYSGLVQPASLLGLGVALRIGIDARLFYYQPAGIGHYTLRLAQALAGIEAGGELVLFRHWRDGKRLDLNGRVVHHRLFTPCHHRLEQVTLPIELAWRRLDVLHSPDFIPPFRRRCPAVITVHDLAFLRLPGLLTGASARYYGQIGRAVRSAEGIIAVSECTRRDLVELVGAPPERIAVVYEAADPVFRPLCQEDAAALPGEWALPERFVLFVGTVEPRKNLGVLLRAVADVPGLGLVLAGRTGWLANEVEALLARPELAGRVRRLGPVSLDQLVKLYNQARLVAVPSLYEGFGLPAVEAMACGTPVVASRAGALPEVVGPAGILLAPQDVTGWRDALTRLAEDGALHEDLARRSLLQAARFSWRRAAEETLAVYRRAVGQ